MTNATADPAIPPTLESLWSRSLLLCLDYCHPPPLLEKMSASALVLGTFPHCPWGVFTLCKAPSSVAEALSFQKPCGSLDRHRLGVPASRAWGCPESSLLPGSLCHSQSKLSYWRRCRQREGVTTVSSENTQSKPLVEIFRGHRQGRGAHASSKAMDLPSLVSRSLRPHSEPTPDSRPGPGAGLPWGFTEVAERLPKGSHRTHVTGQERTQV